MFVFALVKQSPKQSASRDPRWDRSKKKKKKRVFMHVCVVFSGRGYFLRSLAFALLLVSLPAGDDPTLIVLSKSVAVYKVRGLCCRSFFFPRLHKDELRFVNNSLTLVLF